MFPWFGGMLKRPEGELQIDFQSCLDQSDQHWSICRGWLLPSQEALRTRWKSQIILLFLTVKKCSFIVTHSYSQDLTGDSHASSHPTEILFKLAQAVRSAHPGTSMHTSAWSDSACLSVFQARWRHQSPKLQMLKMQRSPKSPKSLKSRKHQLASGASWIFLVLVVGLVSRPICGARWHSMFVTVSKWTWLYPNATFSFVQDLRLALLFQPKREMERYPQKNMFDLHSYHGNRQSIQVKMAPGYGCLQILQNIYYHILFNHIYICVYIILYHHIQMIKRIESWFESMKHNWTCMKVVQLRHCAGFVISPSPGLAQPDTPVGSPSQDLLLGILFQAFFNHP